MGPNENEAARLTADSLTGYLLTMSNFNWQTDEDVVWDEEPSQATATAVPGRRPWLTWLIIGAAIIAAGVFIIRQVNDRLETATADTQRDILASHKLLQQAARQNDQDLFNTLLSGRSKQWSSLQTALVENGQLFDRSALGLTWLKANSEQGVELTGIEGESPNIEIQINPEFTSAEVTFIQEYAIAAGHGLTETVQLQQTAVYRRGRQRWLYSPPDDEFWGEYETNQGAILTTAYPLRDAEIAERLAFDLDAKLNEMCQVVADLDCPADLRVHLRLDNDMQSMLDLADPFFSLKSDLRLVLPTPTLTGLPANEAAYEALYRGYATQLVTAVITNLVAYECCDQGAFFQALLTHQLSQLGLRPFPGELIDYERALQIGFSFEELSQSWTGSPFSTIAAEQWRIYTAVDFLRQQLPRTSIVAWQRQINNQRFISDWLIAVAGETATEINDISSMVGLNNTWEQYVVDHVAALQESSPIPFPEQSLYALCNKNRADLGRYTIDLHRLRFDEMTWELVQADTQYYFLNPLPADDGLIMLKAEEDLDPSQSIIWRDGEEQLKLPANLLSLGQFDPSHEWLLAFDLLDAGPTGVLIDTQKCQAGDCSLYPLAGLPTWSPQGTDFLLIPHEALGNNPFLINDRYYLFDIDMPFDWQLYRGDGAEPDDDLNELVEIGSGYSPFWLNETRYGYLRQIPLSSDSRQHELVVASTADDSFQTLFSDNDLLLLVPEEEDRPVNLAVSMRLAIPHPLEPETILLVAFSSPGRLTYLFSYNLVTEELLFHFGVGLGLFNSVGLSPNGRYITLITETNASNTMPGTQLLLYDLLEKKLNTFASVSLFTSPSNLYDWSADGQWLAIILNERAFLLSAPDYNYQQILPHSFGQCSNVLWQNR